MMTLARNVVARYASARWTWASSWTPLMRAAWEGHARVAELLLTAGADRDKPDGHFRKNS